MKAGTSLAQGDGLRFRGESWGFGALYPILIGGVAWISSGPESTYELVKLVNALSFALASIPIYLVARRLLPPRPSVGVVALAALIPSSMYVSVVMTEAVGYLLAWWAIYAIVVALERPTVLRQLGVVGTTGVAVLERPQFVTLFAGYLLGLAVMLSVSPIERAAIRRAPGSLWPTLLSLVGGGVWIARLLGHSGRSDALSYAPLARGYDPLAVAKWTVYELGDLGLYLGVVPLVVAPVVVLHLARRARSGSQPHASFLALFVGQNIAGIAMVAAFASTSFGLGIVYDRYLYYFVPLWLIALGFWLHAGAPRPVTPLIVGAVAAVGVVAVLPYGVIGRASWFNQFEALATKLWWKVGSVAARLPLVSLRDVAIAFAVTVVVLVALLPRRFAWTLAAAIAVVFVANSALAWRSAFVDPAAFGIGSPGARSWADDQVGAEAAVAVLTVGGACPAAAVDRFAGLETEFFNLSVRQNVRLGGEGGQAPTAITVATEGRLVFRSGRSFSTPYLVAPPGIAFYGSRLAGGTAAGLVLWKLSDGVRVRNAHSDQQLESQACGT